jgi:hypothetical protein
VLVGFAMERLNAWCAIESMEIVVKEGDVFDSMGEAYAFVMIKLAGLVEKRWYEIEALAFALYERWVESEEGIGRVDGDELPQIIERKQGENEHA